MIDTQAMSVPNSTVIAHKPRKPFKPKEINAFTDKEREELKQIIREVLNE